MAQIEFVEKLPSEVIKEAENLNEIPNKIRFLVEGAPNIESKIATLEKFYDKVEMHPTQKGNFIVTDEKGEQLIVDNKNKTNLGDVIDIGKELTEVAGSIAGAVGGTAVAPGAGTIVGSGAGMALGAELFEKIAKSYGTEVLRTNKEHAAQRMTDFAFGSIGQAVAPLILKGFKGSLVGFGKAAVASRQRLKSFIDAGVSPTLGQVSQKRGIQTVEMVLGNFPGSSGRIAEHALKAQDDLGTVSLNIAKNLFNKTMAASEVEVGKTITQGIKKVVVKDGVNSVGGFVGRFQSKAATLFGELDNYLKPNAKIRLDGTVAKLKELVSPVPGAEKTSIVFKNQFLDDILKGLEEDLAKGGGTLPYQAIKSIKGKIGNKLSSFDLVSPVDKAQLKMIYGVLSEDIKLALKGNIKGLRALSKANKFYSKGLERIDDYLEPIMKIADPDRIVSTLLNSAKEGATRVNAIKKSLTPDQFKVFVSSVIDRLGRIQPAQALGGEMLEGTGKFSSETFLTNWAKLSEKGRDVLFSGKGWTKDLIKSFDDIVDISSIIRQSGKTFKNPSGTADRVVGQGIMLGGGASVFTGNPAFIFGVLGFIGGANITSRLFTNPSFIKWLAQGTKISATRGMDGVLTHLAKLGTVMGNADSETRQFIYEYLQMLMGKRKEDTDVDSGSQSAIPSSTNYGIEQGIDTTQVATLPTTGTQNVAPLPESPNINPAAFSVASIDQTGLTPSENAFLDEQEKVMKLRERGIA